MVRSSVTTCGRHLASNLRLLATTAAVMVEDITFASQNSLVIDRNGKTTLGLRTRGSGL